MVVKNIGSSYPQLLRSHSREIDGSFTVHSGCLGSISIEGVGGDDSYAFGFPAILGDRWMGMVMIVSMSMRSLIGAAGGHVCGLDLFVGRKVFLVFDDVYDDEICLDYGFVIVECYEKTAGPR